MSETNPAVTTEPPAQGQPVEAPKIDETDWKAKSREWERRAKENKAAADELAELKQANMTELEKAKKAADEANAELQRERAASLRQRVALAKGLPADLVDRLRGDTESDIAADADALLALVNAPRTPLPDPTQGTQGAAPTTPEQEFLAFTANLP